MAEKHILLIHTWPEKGDEAHMSEEEWNQMYNDILPNVVKLDPILSAQRFKLSDHQVATILSPLPGPDEAEYIAIYEVESPEQAAAILAEVSKNQGAHGTKKSLSRYYTSISDHVEKP